MAMALSVKRAIGMTRTVRDVMTTPVVTVRPDTPFKQVAATVRAVGTVPVTDGSGLVRGIVSERDLLARTARRGRPSGRLAGMRRRGGRTAAAASAAGPDGTVATCCYEAAVGAYARWVTSSAR